MEVREVRIAGIDVSKATLEVWVEEGARGQFGNDAAGIEKLVEWLRGQGVNKGVCEPTGGYERRLVEELKSAGMGVQIAHPNKVRVLARAGGYEAKTDGKDAQVLARFGQVFASQEQEDEGEKDPAVGRLQELVQRREQLVNERVRETNRLDKGLGEVARDSTQRHIDGLNDEIHRLDQERQTLLDDSPSLAQRINLYCSVPGIGPSTATILAVYLPELGRGSSQGLVSLVGLAPWSRDSGRQRGHRSIRGGRGRVRKALYMAALSLTRYPTKELGSFYHRLRNRGKTGKVALVAVMRKLLLQLHAIARRGTPWMEGPLPVHQ
ncbi:MAG: IS110 family transposase [Chloroflexota bacterium]|nr:IS110 family transposase [Chloroflexota bacterium]